MAENSDVQFQFGSVELSNVLTREYREEAVTDPSNTDLAAVKHHIVVQGTLTRGLPPAETGEVAGDVLAALRRYMLRHRRYLCVGMGGKKILEVGNAELPDDPAYNKDAMNGPKCLWVSAVNIAEACITVECCVEAVVVPCEAQTRSVLFHRFQQREDYDSAGYCTVTTSGVIHTRSDIEKAPTQILEGAGLPKIRAGYTRIGKSFTLSEDGLKLTYVLTDREYHVRPPEGAVEADGNFAIITGPNGSGAYAEITVRLKGFKDTPKFKLYELAANIALTKTLSTRAEDKDGLPSSVQSRAVEQLFENVIEVQFSVLADQAKLFPGRDARGNPDGRGQFRTGLFTESYRRLSSTREEKRRNPELPVPVNPGEAEGKREEVLRDGQLVDLLRAALQEPCAELAVVRQPVTKSRPTSGARGQLEGIIGVPENTPGPEAGGGGSLTPQQVDAILSGNGRAVADAFGVPVPGASNFGTAEGLLPASDYPPSLMDLYRPDPGGAGVPADNQFGAFGTNSIGSNPASPGVDPPDVRLPYTSYRVTIDHELDTARRIIPGCGPADKTGRLPRHPVVQVGNPRLTLAVAWTAERIGAPPQLPDPCAGDPNVVLLNKRIRTEEPRITAGGQWRYVVSGRYLYAVREPSLFPLLEAVPPFLIPDVLADAAAGIDVGAKYTQSKGILWLRLKTSPPSPLFAPEGVSNLAGPLPATPAALGGLTAPGNAAGAGGTALPGQIADLLGGLDGYSSNPGG